MPMDTNDISEDTIDKEKWGIEGVPGQIQPL